LYISNKKCIATENKILEFAVKLNDSSNNILEAKAVLFHEGVDSVGSPNMASRDLCNDLNNLSGSHAKQFGSRGKEKADENNLVDVIQCKHISLGTKDNQRKKGLNLYQSRGRLCLKKERMMSPWLLKIQVLFLRRIPMCQIFLLQLIYQKRI
jgi:hypothetical protein